MTKGKCKVCGHCNVDLQRHHLIPQRIKESSWLIYICEKCHNEIHAENKYIMEFLFLAKYHRRFKKFVKHNAPDVYKLWSENKENIKSEIKLENQPEKLSLKVDND